MPCAFLIDAFDKALETTVNVATGNLLRFHRNLWPSEAMSRLLASANDASSSPLERDGASTFMCQGTEPMAGSLSQRWSRRFPDYCIRPRLCERHTGQRRGRLAFNRTTQDR